MTNSLCKMATIAATLAACTGAAFFGTSHAWAQEAAKRPAAAEARLQQFPLAAQIPSAAGYELRMRRVTLPAGGATVEHAHKDRPGMVYLLEGTMTEYRGDVARVLKPGDSLICDASTAHRYTNTTDKIAVFLAVDLVKK